MRVRTKLLITSLSGAAIMMGCSTTPIEIGMFPPPSAPIGVDEQVWMNDCEAAIANAKTIFPASTHINDLFAPHRGNTDVTWPEIDG